MPSAGRGPHNASAARTRGSQPGDDLLVNKVAISLLIGFLPPGLDSLHDRAGDGGGDEPRTSDRLDQRMNPLIGAEGEVLGQSQIDAIDSVWRVSGDSRHQPRHVIDHGSYVGHEMSMRAALIAYD